MRRRTLDGGQATVEFALVLPLVFILTACVAQVGLFTRDAIATIHAAREGARAASIDDTGAPAEAAFSSISRVGGLDPERRTVTTSLRPLAGGTLATVTVRYRSRVIVPIIGRFVRERTLTARVSMMLEPPIG